MKTEGIQYIAYRQVVHTIVFFSVDIDGFGVGVGSIRLRHLNRTLMDFFSHRTPHSPWPTDEKSFFTFFFISKNETALAL